MVWGYTYSYNNQKVYDQGAFVTTLTAAFVGAGVGAFFVNNYAGAAASSIVAAAGYVFGQNCYPLTVYGTIKKDYRQVDFIGGGFAFFEIRYTITAYDTVKGYIGVTEKIYQADYPLSPNP